MGSLFPSQFSFLSSPPRYTCSSPEDDAVFLLLPVEGPVIVTSESDGNRACFCVDLDEGDNVTVPLEGGRLAITLV